MKKSRVIESVEDAGAEPLRIGAGSARSLLLTVLGEFVLPASAPVWTSVLLHALAGVGIAEKAARQALARASAAGWIESRRDGRRAAWSLGERGHKLIADGSKRVRSLRGDAEAWTGDWMVLHVSLPETRRADRLRFYRALNWIGFGNPTPGVWISPHLSRAQEARRVIDEMALADHTMAFTGRLLDMGLSQAQIVAQAWRLDEVAEHYAALVERFAAMHPRSDDELLFAHVQLVNALQRLPYVDPGLPPALLPASWDSARQTAKLTALRQKWREPAHARWERLSAEPDEPAV